MSVSTQTRPVPPAPPAITYVFVCGDGTDYVVRAGGKEAWVFRPTGTLRLPIAESSTEQTYGDGTFELRISGEQAQFRAAGGQPQTCRNDRARAVWEKAKLDGVDFRAVGNEPAWVLEILRQSRMVLMTGYDQRRVEVPLPPPREDKSARTTRWNADELQVEVVLRPCHDTMSGEAFESTVVVVWQGRTMRGCGRALH